MKENRASPHADSRGCNRRAKPRENPSVMPDRPPGAALTEPQIGYPPPTGGRRTNQKAPASASAFFGAATQIRTGDLILTKDVLYHLSHSSTSQRILYYHNHDCLSSIIFNIKRRYFFRVKDVFLELNCRFFLPFMIELFL